MTQYNTLNVKLSILQRNKLKPCIKNNTEVTLKISSNIVGDSNFLHQLLLTNTQVSKLCKAFANDSSANMKLRKTPLHKIGQSGEFIGLRYLIAPIKGLFSVSQFIDNKLKNVLKNKDKISNTIKQLNVF